MKDIITNPEGNGETKGLTDIQSVLPIKVEFFDIVSQVTKQFMVSDPAYDNKNPINSLEYDNERNRYGSFYVFLAQLPHCI